ncbi:MAG TPA: DUF2934 domain-containing protein [Candidatus Aquilonibacter sp.]|nr:DUF2934 domain-containing protein [Candidatus Aquilonibacter sp.]
MAEQVEPNHAQIRQRAYELFQERGGTHGKDIDDWLAAEQQLRAAAFENLLRTIVERRSVAPARWPSRLAEHPSAAAA